jgi:uncharacterized protein YggE
LQNNAAVKEKVVALLVANGIDTNKLQTGNIDTSKISEDLKKQIKV